MGLVFWFLMSVMKFDIEKPRFENHFLAVISETSNIKWLLVGVIFYSLALFNLAFSYAIS